MRRQASVRYSVLDSVYRSVRELMWDLVMESV